MIVLFILYFYGVSLIAANDIERTVVNLTNQEKCKLPEPPEHGSYTSSPAAEPGEILDSVQLNVTCRLGYKLTGDGIVSCSHGQWRQPVPTCRQFCLQNGRALVYFTHCVYASGEIFLRSDSKYKPEAPADDTTSGKDDKSEPCVLPPVPRNGQYVSTPPGSPGDVLPSFELKMSCRSGFEVVGATNITCTSGKLSSRLPVCMAPCAPLGNDAVILACEDVLDSTERIVITVNNTTTEIIKTTNNLESCVLPPRPQHGWYNSFPPLAPGTSTAAYLLNVTCAPGYHLVGNNSMKCIFGLVEEEMPICMPYCKIGQQSESVTFGEENHSCRLTAPVIELLNPKTVHEDEVCGIVGSPRRRRLPISGGYTPAPQEFPWHTAIYKMVSESQYAHICGGTLISKTVVVTAAHCFSLDRQRPSPELYEVAAGKSIRWWAIAETHSKKFKVEEIKIPPRYQGAQANFQEDIALVITAKKFKYSSFIRPACISFNPKFDAKQLEPGNLGKIAGWGLTDEDATQTRALQAAYLPYISIDDCIEDSPVSFKSSITGDKICAGYKNGTSACRGDSGGGFVVGAVKNGITRYYLHGVISTSPVTDKACNVYTWITFTHILRHEHFIKSVVPNL